LNSQELDPPSTAWLAQKRKVAMALVKTLGHKSRENKEDKLGEKR